MHMILSGKVKGMLPGKAGPSRIRHQRRGPEHAGQETPQAFRPKARHERENDRATGSRIRHQRRGPEHTGTIS